MSNNIYQPRNSSTAANSPSAGFSTHSTQAASNLRTNRTHSVQANSSGTTSSNITPNNPASKGTLGREIGQILNVLA